MNPERDSAAGRISWVDDNGFHHVMRRLTRAQLDEAACDLMKLGWDFEVEEYGRG